MSARKRHLRLESVRVFKRLKQALPPSFIAIFMALHGTMAEIPKVVSTMVVIPKVVETEKTVKEVGQMSGEARQTMREIASHGAEIPKVVEFEGTVTEVGQSFLEAMRDIPFLGIDQRAVAMTSPNNSDEQRKKDPFRRVMDDLMLQVVGEGVERQIKIDKEQQDQQKLKQDKQTQRELQNERTKIHLKRAEARRRLHKHKTPKR